MHVRVLLLCSAFNGVSQRVWLDLRDAGHRVSVRLSGDADAIRAAVGEVDPDLIVCPYLRERVPTDVWRRYRTIIVHPGPPGDRGPSSLDWAIIDGVGTWGVTALEAIDEMDAGPVWASRTFPLPDDPPRKSTLYNGPVADAAVAVVREVVDRVAAGAGAPVTSHGLSEHGTGTARPLMRQQDRAFSWCDTTDRIVRRIRAADGAPGVRSELAGVAVSVFDVHRGPEVCGTPGTIVGRRHGAVLVRTGDATVWIGQVRVRTDGVPPVKLPAAAALTRHLGDVPDLLDVPGPLRGSAPRQIRYTRDGDVGVLTFDVHNGALSAGQSRRLLRALRRATQQDTRVLVLRGGETFATGIHLGVIEAAPDPDVAAWHAITAIDDVCREIITCTDQLVVAAVGGNAGAGGVMLALGADQVLLRDGVVLNPHYTTMGLFGSEYWTYVLPRRVGFDRAWRLTDRCLPVSATEALSSGLADGVIRGSRAEFDEAVLEHASSLACSTTSRRLLHVKRMIREDDERLRPLETYRARELAEMSHDIFDDRNGFAAARHAFITRQRPVTTPVHLVAADDEAPPAGTVAADRRPRGHRVPVSAGQ